MDVHPEYCARQGFRPGLPFWPFRSFRIFIMFAGCSKPQSTRIIRGVSASCLSRLSEGLEHIGQPTRASRAAVDSLRKGRPRERSQLSVLTGWTPFGSDIFKITDFICYGYPKKKILSSGGNSLGFSLSPLISIRKLCTVLKLRKQSRTRGVDFWEPNS